MECIVNKEICSDLTKEPCDVCRCKECMEESCGECLEKMEEDETIALGQVSLITALTLVTAFIILTL